MNDIDRNIGIYKITSPSGRVYIGETDNLKRREKVYKNMNCKSQPRIYNSLKKYGWENHKFEVIGNCLYEDLKKLEHLIVAEYRELLGERNVMTLRTSYEDKCYIAEELREKFRECNKGKNNPNYGKKASDETRKLMSEKALGENNHNYGKFGSEHHGAVKINQYDLNGKYLKTFSCVKEVYIYFNKKLGGSISQVCKGKRKTSWGFIWRYHSEFPNCDNLNI